jgi:glycosyltransferase involved in cell wall biosynthesis
MPDVSVIIPTHNRLWSLPKAIASCRQRGLNVEIIVVDDGSTDGTWDWLQQQTGLVALRQYNLGQCWAKNTGFARARSKYVRFLDSDDWYHEDTFRHQFEIAESEQADIVVAGCSVSDNDQILMRRNWISCDDFVAQQLGECDNSHHAAYFYRREFLANLPHRQDAASLDDRLFVLEAALMHPKVAVYSPPAVNLRNHTKGRIQFPNGMRSVVTNFAHLQIYRRILTILDGRGELTLRRKRAAINSLWPLAHWIAYTHLNEACEVANWISELDPEFRPPEPGALGLLYRRLGFRRTEEILKLRRMFLKPFRT